MASPVPRGTVSRREEGIREYRAFPSGGFGCRKGGLSLCSILQECAPAAKTEYGRNEARKRVVCFCTQASGFPYTMDWALAEAVLFLWAPAALPP